MAKFGVEIFLAPILRYHWKIWYKFPDCGTRTSIDCEWWLLFPTGLWLVAVICWGLLDGCSGFWRRLSTMKCACQESSK